MVALHRTHRPKSKEEQWCSLGEQVYDIAVKQRPEAPERLTGMALEGLKEFYGDPPLELPVLVIEEWLAKAADVVAKAGVMETPKRKPREGAFATSQVKAGVKRMPEGRSPDEGLVLDNVARTPPPSNPNDDGSQD
jgi:hypothetical protein